MTNEASLGQAQGQSYEGGDRCNTSPRRHLGKPGPHDRLWGVFPPRASGPAGLTASGASPESRCAREAPCLGPIPHAPLSSHSERPPAWPPHSSSTSSTVHAPTHVHTSFSSLRKQKPWELWPLAQGWDHTDREGPQGLQVSKLRAWSLLSGKARSQMHGA